MKVIFKEVEKVPVSELVIYSSLNPIPFTLKLGIEEVFLDTIYARNLAGENFLEFRFDLSTKRLYEITLIAVQNDSVENIGFSVDENENFYNCYIDESSQLDISVPIKIERAKKSLSFIWGSKEKRTFCVAKNCMLGIDDDGFLCSISLINLNEDLIFEILGF